MRREDSLLVACCYSNCAIGIFPGDLYDRQVFIIHAQVIQMNTKFRKKCKPHFREVLMGFMFFLIINLQYAAAYGASDFKDDIFAMAKSIFLPIICIVGAAFLIGKVMESEAFHWFPKVLMSLFLIGFMVGACKIFPDPIGSTFDKVWSFAIFWD